MRVNRVTIEGRAFGWWQKDGKRGMEINLIKTRQEVSADFLFFSSAARPLIPFWDSWNQLMAAELSDRVATGFLGPVHAQPSQPP
jgi:hypothetical protein